MDASVIIPTYNRSDLLKRTLLSLALMNISRDRSWEIIVVDNNSTDRTKSVVEEYCHDYELKVVYEFEKTQGKSFALNRGIEAARGRILAFTDDDVFVDRDWLANILEIFNKTDASCVGGKILLEWEVPRPAWLYGLLVDQSGLLDLGEDIVKLKIPKVYGANFAVRAEVIHKYGGFDTHIGPVGNKMCDGEDIFFIERLINREETVIHCPAVVVRHFIPKEHIRKIYFLKRNFDQGESTGIQMGEYRHRNLLGIPYYLYKKSFMLFFHSVFALTSDPAKAMSKQVDLARCLGMMYGRLKFAKSSRNVL